MVKSILFLVFLSVSVLAVRTPEEHFGVSIDSEVQLADYIKAMLGYNTPELSNKLKNFISAHELSVMNALDEIALVLLYKNNEIDQGNNFNISPQFMRRLDNVASKIHVFNLSDKSTEEVEEFIAANLNGKEVKRIYGSMEELKQIHDQISMKKQRRMLEQSTPKADTSFSYITKFFFALIFIIVSLGSLGAIANMENKKDTLLYAKFIADVGR